MTTEDAALILLRYEGGARGSVAISQVSAGRKNSLQWEVDGSSRVRVLGLGDARPPLHRPSRPAERDPAARRRAHEPGRHRGREPAGRPRGGLRGHVPCALPRGLRAVLAGRPAGAARATRPSRTATTRCSSATPSRRAPATAAGSTSPTRLHPSRRETDRVKLGFLTAPFPDTELMDVADWAARRLRGPRDRLLAAGTGDARATRARRTSTSRTCPSRRRARSWTRSRRKGLEICGLGLLPEPAAPGPGGRAAAIEHLKHVIVATGRMGLPVTNTFCGGDASKHVDANWEEALASGRTSFASRTTTASRSRSRTAR